jgi:hypothetical protein
VTALRMARKAEATKDNAMNFNWTGNNEGESAVGSWLWPHWSSFFWPCLLVRMVGTTTDKAAGVSSGRASPIVRLMERVSMGRGARTSDVERAAS